MFNSLWLHNLQHTRLLCPSLYSRVFSSSWPLSRWYHTIISSSVAPFSSCPQFFPASESFPVNWFFRSDGKNMGASASSSVLPMNIQDWFPLGLTGLISLQSKGLSWDFSSITVWKHQFFSIQLFLWFLSHIGTWLLEKTKLWLLDICWQYDVFAFLVLCLVSLSLSSKEQAPFNFMAAGTIWSVLGAQENKIWHFHCFPFYLLWCDGICFHDLCFLNVEFQGAFPLSFFTLIKRLFLVPLHFH